MIRIIDAIAITTQQMKINLISKLQLTSVLLSITTMNLLAQGNPPASIDDALSHLPAVELKEDGPQHYIFTCDYLNFDLAGNITGKERVSGDYTRGLPDGKVRWNNVRIAQTKNASATFPEGTLQKYMEDFSYTPGNSGQFKSTFFAGFPEDSMRVKTLVWDVTMFEHFAWKYFDKLKLNEPFEIGASDIALPGGNFSNRLPTLTWVGLSQMNGKKCAVIQYEAFYNKLNLQAGTQTLNGRSDYSGTIWVSLSDKQIEKGTLNEGVLLGIVLPGQNAPQPISIFRQATFCRRK